MTYALNVIFEKLLLSRARRYLRNTNTVTEINICSLFLLFSETKLITLISYSGDTFFFLTQLFHSESYYKLIKIHFYRYTGFILLVPSPHFFCVKNSDQF